MAIKVYVVYYSMYGLIENLAKELARGANSVEGVEATLWQVPETLSAEELQNLRAPPKSDVPIITPNELTRADGIIFAFETVEDPQFKAFLDQCKTQKFAGKPATLIITSKGNKSGKHEIPTTNNISPLYDHGMVTFLLTLGIEFPNNNDSVVESLTRSPTFLLLVSFHNGYYFASITKKFIEDAGQR